MVVSVLDPRCGSRRGNRGAADQIGNGPAVQLALLLHLRGLNEKQMGALPKFLRRIRHGQPSHGVGNIGVCDK